MLGPDASFVQEGAKYIPLSRKLANRLVDGFKDKEEYKSVDLRDLPQAAMYHCIEEGVQRVLLKETASEFFDRKCKKLCPNDLYLNLAELPFYFIVTSTPDKMIIEALKEKNKQPIVESYNFTGRAGTDVPIERASAKSPLVYYLYGISDEPDSLVLTEEDLLDYIVSVISDNPPIPDKVLNELRKDNRSLLFLGFGLKHWYLRIILHVLRGKSKEKFSIAFEDLVPKSTKELERTVLFYRKSDYNIKICDDSICSFVEKLKDKMQRGMPPIPLDPAPRRGLPSVFICHAHENADAAENMFNALKSENLNPWLDKEVLKGGDSWPRVLEDRIAQCDYFVVLLSEALTEHATIGMRYVNKEIVLALERQKEISPFSKIRFMIPVKIEKSDSIAEIPEIQSIDFSDYANYDKLIQTIKDDYDRRYKRKEQLNMR
jgi:hypothetical protein